MWPRFITRILEHRVDQPSDAVVHIPFFVFNILRRLWNTIVVRVRVEDIFLHLSFVPIEFKDVTLLVEGDSLSPLSFLYFVAQDPGAMKAF